MPPIRVAIVLPILFWTGSFAAPAAASTAISLSFNASGTGEPNSLSATGPGTLTPYGAATVTVTTAGNDPTTLNVAFTFSVASGGTLSASSSNGTYTAPDVAGTATITGGTGQFAGATGSFSYELAAPLGAPSSNVQVTITGSGSINTESTMASLPDAMVGVPYSAYIGPGANQNPGAQFGLSSGSNLPPGLTLSTSGLVSGTPTAVGNFNFNVDFQQATAAGGTLAVSLNITGNSGPAIAVNPGSLTFSLTQGSTAIATQSIVIANSGGAAQNFTATSSASSGGNWLTISPASGAIAAFGNAAVSVNVDPSRLQAGTYSGTVAIAVSPLNQQFQIAVLVTVNGGQAELKLSQSGLRFRTLAGGGAPASQSITILGRGSGSLKFSVSTSTTSAVSGWLTASPSSGAITASSSATVSVNIQPGNLPPGDYYGQVLVTADGAANSPQTTSVVLNVAAAGTDLGAFVEPTGLIFVGQSGGADPAAKTISVSNPSPSNLTYSAASFFTQGGNWFTVQPASGVVSAANPAQITVMPVTMGLAPGVYSGEIVLHFAEDNSTRHIETLLIVTPGAAAKTEAHATAPVCIPTKLLPVFTQLGAGFAAVAAWPTPIEVTVVDDCGNFLTAGSVTASFSDGDPALPLTSLEDGRWSATWQPASTAQVVITADALEIAPPLEGTQSIGGALAANPTTPSINAGGVVSAGKYASNQPLAPGGFTSIYGVHLSTGQNPALALPLPIQLGATQVVLGGRALPLQYAGDGQINVVIPYDVPPNSTQQLIVANGPALSVPQTIAIAPAQPAVFAQADGYGVVFDVKPNSSAQVLADADHPISAGDAIVIYCAGLGPVNPPVAAGDAAPSSPSAMTTNPVTVTIGGKSAQVFFGGLVGGFAGLYQVNAYVPTGVAAGKSVPLIVSVAGLDSAPVTVAVQ